MLVGDCFIEAKLKDFQYLAYSSYSHQPSAPRWRFFVPYAKPASRVQHEKVYDLMQRLFEGQLDQRCKTTNQLWYTPACPPDAVQHFEFFYGAGALLDVDVDAGEAAPVRAELASIPGLWKLAAGTACPVAESATSNLLAPRGNGERTNALMKLAGTYVADGLTGQEVLARCMLWNETNTPPLSLDRRVP